MLRGRGGLETAWRWLTAIVAQLLPAAWWAYRAAQQQAQRTVI